MAGLYFEQFELGMRFDILLVPKKLILIALQHRLERNIELMKDLKIPNLV